MRLRDLTWVLWPALLLLPTSRAVAGQPLLVVAELTPDAAVSAEEIRAQVAAELGDAVVGPADLEGATAVGTLIVEVDARAAILAFHPREGAIRRRRVDLPADRHGRRKTIAWVAENLVRDQAAGVGEARVDQAPVGPPEAPTAPPAPLPAVPAASSSRSPASPAADLPVAAAQAQATSEVPSRWSLAVSGGPTLRFIGINWHWAPSRGGNEWQIEAHRSMGTWTAGLALDLGEYDTPLGGLAGFLGDGWERKHWRLEGTAGLGLELTKRQVPTTHQTYDSRTGYSSVVDVSTELRPRLYGRGNLTLAWRRLRPVDFTLRLALHVETDDQTYCYGAALLGLRMNVP
jgi:hypothetical protein